MTRKEVGGRPIGRKKTAKIEVAIEPVVKSEFMNILQMEGKCASTEITKKYDKLCNQNMF